MADVDTKARREADGKNAAATRSAEPAPVLLPIAPARRRFRVLPLLITLSVIAVAAGFGGAMWNPYMGAPWPRDGTVRAYVVTMAPQVAGQIVELPFADNHF